MLAMASTSHLHDEEVGRLTMQLADHADRLLRQVPAEDRPWAMAEFTDALDGLGVILEDAEIPFDEGTWPWAEAAMEHNDLLGDVLVSRSDPRRALRTHTWEAMARALLDH